MSRLQLLFDDDDLNIQYTPPTAWVDNTSALWTNGHSKVPNQFPGASLQFTFNGGTFISPISASYKHECTGTSALFHGASLNNSVFTPVIDNLPQSNHTLPISNPPSYGVWYQTPDLPPGTHTVTIHDIPAVTLDYIIVEVDPSMVFPPNAPLLISDSDPSVKYSGNWKQDYSRFQTLQPFTFIGDYNTRSSCNPGDSLSLDFSGSSIKLWGVFDWKSIGQVTAEYWIDGQQVAEQPYQADSTSQNSIFGVQTNYPLFTHDLSDGLHNLMVNISSCTRQRFSLDYITYTPSFTSGNDAPTGQPTTGVQVSKTSHFPPGAIAGIVVGVVVLAVAGLGLWYYVTRRKMAAAPFPTSPPSTAVTRKEQVPAHMRYLGSQPSNSTVRTNTIDITNGTSHNESWVLAPDPSEIRNINELVASTPPPAYPTFTGENFSQVNAVRRS